MLRMRAIVLCGHSVYSANHDDPPIYFSVCMAVCVANVSKYTCNQSRIKSADHVGNSPNAPSHQLCFIIQLYVYMIIIILYCNYESHYYHFIFCNHNVIIDIIMT